MDQLVENLALRAAYCHVVDLDEAFEEGIIGLQACKASPESKEESKADDRRAVSRARSTSIAAGRDEVGYPQYLVRARACH
jgi:hypothetical protein